MVDTDALDRARKAVSERADLPGMSLMEHLEELRKRLIHSIAYLFGGCVIAGIFDHALTNFIQKPLNNYGLKLTQVHPTDAINFDIKTAIVFGAIFASPFILYQVWLFISPGMYANEKKYVVPFMSATVSLFLIGAWFGYRYVLPRTMEVLVLGFGKNFNHMIGIEEYTSFFLAVILGLGITFELPILIFFLSLFGIVDAKFLLRHFRYAILAIFVVAAAICPDPSPVGMCLFATPMLALYFVGIAIAWYVHPSRRKRKGSSRGMTPPLVRRNRLVILSGAKNPRICLAVLLALLIAFPAAAQQKPAPAPGISGQAIYTVTQQFLAAAPKRFNGSPGHLAAENFIKDHFKPEAAKGNFETDQFTANTPAGMQTMRNYIVRYPGKKDGVIVLVSHYETNYPLRNIAFVGANDGACTTALLIELGAYFRTHPPQGYSIWLVFDDGEEAVQQWSDSDSLYGTRHLAAKWYADGTLKRIKAVLIADMIGDKDLNILEETQSAPWLRDLMRQAGRNTNHAANVFQTQAAEDDDHLPFVKRGVPSLDVIDVDYGPHTNALPDGYHHTAQDTIDKISPKSLQISADLFLETIRLINQR